MCEINLTYGKREVENIFAFEMKKKRKNKINDVKAHITLRSMYHLRETICMKIKASGNLP